MRGDIDWIRGIISSAQLALLNALRIQTKNLNLGTYLIDLKGCWTYHIQQEHKYFIPSFAEDHINLG